jgi:ATP adenylyltransferase
MQRLWTPWRMAYVTTTSEVHACVFCGAQDETNPGPAALMVFRGRTCFVILNLYPYNNGHLMVVPYRHVASLDGMSAGERDELMELTRRAEVALTEAYRPHGLNIGINLGKAAGAGVVDHLHVHLVPRWNGDTNFMSVVGDTRVLPEDLHESAARLRPIFERLGEQTASRG